MIIRDEIVPTYVSIAHFWETAPRRNLKQTNTADFGSCNNFPIKIAVTVYFQLAHIMTQLLQTLAPSSVKDLSNDTAHYKCD